VTGETREKRVRRETREESVTSGYSDDQPEKYTLQEVI
jgi:hypothetical protein